MADFVNTNTGAHSLVGVGLEANEGQPVKIVTLLDRTNGSLEEDDTLITQKSYRNSTSPAGHVAGASNVTGQLTVEPTPAGVSTLLVSAFGIPTTAALSGAGPGAAPAVAVLTQATTGGLITGGQTIYVKLTEIANGVESPASAESNIAVAAGTNTNVVNIAAPAVVGGATLYNVYASATLGQETLQNLAPIPIASTYQLTSNPDTTLQVAPTVASPAFNEHTYKDGFNQKTCTVVDKRGSTNFLFAGCRTTSITATVNKTQTDPVTLMFDMVGLYQVIGLTDTATGLLTAGYDSGSAFGPSDVLAIFGGILTTSASAFTIKPTKTVTPRQVLNGKRGPVSNYIEQSTHTGSATLFFGDETALNRYMGQLDGASGARAAGKSTRPLQLELQINAQPDSAGNVQGMSYIMPRAIYTKVGQPYAGPGAIMQDITIEAERDPTTGTGLIVKVRNYETNATIVTPGVLVTGIPANGVNAYTS